jgi:BirA family biotin operon repressor/biotin-[acetyl-CoA-carboxylase] ligase
MEPVTMARAAQNGNKDNYNQLETFLELLKSPNFSSGQSLAKDAGISRSAVWKQVRKLRQCGYTIESLHGQGYRLAADTTSPVPWELRRILKTSFMGKGRIVYRNSVDSTQSIAIALAEKYQDENIHGAVVIAERQTSARGRMKRKWISPQGGLWLSVLLKPSIPTALSTMLSFVAALAVCEAVRQGTGLRATLKWPNDVMVKDKKVAGILLDLSAEAETINYAIIGIGINVNIDTSRLKIERTGAPAITSLKGELGHNVNRLDLAKLLLENLEHFYNVLEGGKPEEIISEWRQRSDMLGKKVSVMPGQKGKVLEGTVVDVNADGSLLLQSKSGSVNVVSGDIRVIPY